MNGSMTRPLLAIERLSKTFPGLQALQDVGFAVQAGAIVALVGQNGSGKSTLVKILAGVVEPDPGARVLAQGTTHVIHQDLGLIPSSTPSRTWISGGATDSGPRCRPGAARSLRTPASLLREFDAAFDVTVPVGQLTPAERTIARLAKRQPRPQRLARVSSIAGEIGTIGQANYAASKSGLFGFTKTLAREAAFALAKAGKLTDDGIGLTVNAVTPGLIETDMPAAVPAKVIDSLQAAIPMRRIGRPDAIARVVVFLAADASAYITGQVWGVNGGLDM